MQKQKLTSRHHSKRKERYKITNWPEYNRSLKQRGNIRTWIPKKTLENWYFTGQNQRGSPNDYSDACIEICLAIKILYSLGYRQTQGFIESIFTLAQIDLVVPSYSAMCKRSKTIKINKNVLKKKDQEKSIEISVDSTGLKVYGEGEWKVRQHGWSKYRTWQKLHLIINPDERTILGSELTTNAVTDAAVIELLLGQVHEKVKRLTGDGAYDQNIVYKALSDKKIKCVIPTRKDAKLKDPGNKKESTHPRDKTIRMIRKIGRAEWKVKERYHKRSLVETIMSRYKTIIGDKLFSRTIERQKTETEIACKLLNIMTFNGMPRSILAKKDDKII